MMIMNKTLSIQSLITIIGILMCMSACGEAKNTTAVAKPPITVISVCREAVTSAVKDMGYKPNATAESLFNNKFSSFEENSYTKSADGLEQLRIGVEADYGGTGLTWFTCEVSHSGTATIKK